MAKYPNIFPNGTDLVQLPVHFARMELIEEAPELQRVDGHDLSAPPVPGVPGRRGSTFRCTFTFTLRAFSRSFDPKQLTNKYICQKKEKEQYIAVGTVRIFIEPGAKN